MSAERWQGTPEKGGAKRHRKFFAITSGNPHQASHPPSGSPWRRETYFRFCDLRGDPRCPESVPGGNVIRDAVTYTEHAKREDRDRHGRGVLKRQGATLYGFGG
ncbi:hypothetical protein DPEC_G00069380 [Dallia pectoralis]|uniref:Uncharacterized protein n=1 Tax=Dallia pectoralis TaxID=75939 RepID=A0ACC2H333_DALPE|nr:hypothetical protein DPEC_G00069380 [Dallia pectoralis]